MHSGIYNLTVFFSLLKHDPLLLATIIRFSVTQSKLGDSIYPVDFTRVDIHPAENTVMTNN